jgi:two-component system phosphate regulon sensor histidine kinase PhoR
VRLSRSYARHVFAFIAIVACLFLATALVVEVHSVHHQADLGERARLEASAMLLSDRYVAALQARTPTSDVATAPPTGMRLSILNAQGVTLADSQFSVASVPNRIDDAAVQQAAVSGKGVETVYRIESGRRERIVSVAVKDAGAIVAFALASSPVELTWQAASGTLSWAIVLLLATCAVWFAVALLLARAATKPIADLADALERRSLGNLTGLAMRANVTELGRAQKASYTLLQENALLVERERSQATVLAAIMDSIPQAIAIVDDTGVILSANSVFDRLFGKGAQPTMGKRFAELVALPDCLAAIDLCRREHKPQTAVTEGHGRTWSCSVREPGEGETGGRGVLVVLEDVTEAVALPRIKADFVTNASHELKTPLTAIRGYLELLHEEPGNPHYLDIIERNVDRLIALSSDISLLSRLENQAPDIELVDMVELKHDLAELFEKQGREIGVPLEFSIDAGGRLLYADRLMLLQLFINLIENAYRFTKAGRITVSSTADSTHIILGVTDTGQGIAPGDLPRIFERFYSHSNDHGRPGTGLGLAIVKRIVLAHNGTIDALSTPGTGTSFVIHIPRSLGPRGQDTPSQQTSKNDKEEP